VAPVEERRFELRVGERDCLREEAVDVQELRESRAEALAVIVAGQLCEALHDSLEMTEKLGMRCRVLRV
jgi:hypothetical protein